MKLLLASAAILGLSTVAFAQTSVGPSDFGAARVYDTQSAYDYGATGSMPLRDRPAWTGGAMLDQGVPQSRRASRSGGQGRHVIDR